MAASFSSMRMGINPMTGEVDLVIDPAGSGRGRIGIDRTAATPLLLAIGTDRRADPDDVTPDMLTALPGQAASLFNRRGWVGDVILGVRRGSRAWLYSRGKADESTRSSIAGCLDEATAAIADYHGITIDTGAVWLDQDNGVLLGSVSALGITATTRVTVL